MNIHIKNIGECQKCGFELTSFLSSSSNYDLKLAFINSPKECDLLIITGCVSKSQLNPLIDFWKKMPQKSRILNFGTCGTEQQDLFSLKEQNLKNLAIENQDMSEILPIDDVIEGCPPTIESISTFFKKK